jgi:uncharacterized protein (DUF433 family)
MIENPGLDELITSRLEVLGGRRVFRGTRVPIEALFENLADGMSLDEILDQFPTPARDDVVRETDVGRMGASESGSRVMPRLYNPVTQKSVDLAPKGIVKRSAPNLVERRGQVCFSRKGRGKR